MVLESPYAANGPERLGQRNILLPCPALLCEVRGLGWVVLWNGQLVPLVPRGRSTDPDRALRKSHISEQHP